MRPPAAATSRRRSGAVSLRTLDLACRRRRARDRRVLLLLGVASSDSGSARYGRGLGVQPRAEGHGLVRADVRDLLRRAAGHRLPRVARASGAAVVGGDGGGAPRLGRAPGQRASRPAAGRGHRRPRPAPSAGRPGLRAAACRCCSPVRPSSWCSARADRRRRRPGWRSPFPWRWRPAAAWIGLRRPDSPLLFYAAMVIALLDVVLFVFVV